MGTEPMDKGVGKGKKGFTTSGLQPNQPLVEEVQPGVPSVLGRNRYNKGTNQKEEYFMESIGRKITFYRKAKGLTQEELSEMVELTPEVKELFESWVALAPNQKSAVLQVVKAMNSENEIKK